MEISSGVWFALGALLLLVGGVFYLISIYLTPFQLTWNAPHPLRRAAFLQIIRHVLKIDDRVYVFDANAFRHV